MPSRLAAAGMPMWSNSTRAILLCRGQLSRFLFREELDLEPLDPRAVDVEHVEADPVVNDLVSGFGRAAELAEDEPGDRVVVLLGQLGLELLVEVVDREGAVDSHVTVPEMLDGLVRKVVFVLDLADDLLQQVLEGDDPLEGAVL